MFNFLQTLHTRRSASVGVWVSLCVAILCAVPAHARALEPTFAQASEGMPGPAAPDLQWSAPPECPDAEQVRQRVASLLAQSASAADLTAVRVNGVVTYNRSSYKLALTVKSGSASGLRVLGGANCTELSETAAWLVAITVDPNVPAVRIDAAAETALTPTAAAPVSPAAPTATAWPLVAPPARVSDWSLHAGAFAGVWQVDHPTLPRAQLGGSFGFRWKLLDLELRGAFALPREQSGNDGLRVRSTTQSYGLAGCARFGGRFRIGPCTGVSLLVTDATTRGVQPARSERALWAALTLGAQASMELAPHLELFGEGGISSALSPRPSFTFGESVTRAVAVAVYARVGLRFRWAHAPGRFRWWREIAMR